MEDIKRIAQSGIDNGAIPGVVLIAKSRDGKLDYQEALGETIFPDGSSRKLELDSPLFIFSCTKLLTAIAALQLVERGLIKLDDDILHLIPELAKQSVIHGFDDHDNPILKPRQNGITFRDLLTHRAGLSYTFSESQTQKAYRNVNLLDKLTVPEMYSFSFEYEPGTEWMYSPSYDWAGLIIEEITGEDLESYFRKNIFQQLGIKDMSFHPRSLRNFEKNVGMTMRDPKSGGLTAIDLMMFYLDGRKCFGGHGVWADLREFAKVLESLLLDDEKVLKKSSVAELFTPQLTGRNKEAFDRVRRTPGQNIVFMGDHPDHVDYNQAIGGMIACEDEGGDRNRRKGTMMWCGMPNIVWFIDREAGLYGIFGTYVQPMSDPKVKEIIKAWETKTYQMHAHA